jgi:hypothetical protein
VVLAVPVTVPYVRYSIRAAHWWLARALSGLLERSGLEKQEIDGLTVSSFTGARYRDRPHPASRSLPALA